MDAQFYEEASRSATPAIARYRFSRRCRMEWRGKIRRFTFITYRFGGYERTAGIRTFSATDLAEFSVDLAAAAAGLTNPSDPASSPSTARAAINAL